LNSAKTGVKRTWISGLDLPLAFQLVQNFETSKLNLKVFEWGSTSTIVFLRVVPLACLTTASSNRRASWVGTNEWLDLQANRQISVVYWWADSWKVELRSLEGFVPKVVQRVGKPAVSALFCIIGAEEGTRTPTPLRVRGPEPRASANSATSARDTDLALSARSAASLSLAKAGCGVKSVSQLQTRWRHPLTR
jgi:hypothetical protein